MSENICVIVHGGAGHFNPEATPRKLPFLKQAVDVAWQKLCAGDEAGNAVEAALRVMEGCEYFNAGYGGYPNVNGIVLLDVGLMSGERNFVSLLNMRRVKYPSSVALEMMKDHQGLITIWTHELANKLEKAPNDLKRYYGLVEKHEDLLAPFVKSLIKQGESELGKSAGHGTVGCVVRDARGKLFAGTSTGGVNTKFNGRIGDTPIIGSGVFADNEICGLSCTGHGESILLSMLPGFVISEMRRELQRDETAFVNKPALLQELLDKEVAEMRRKVAVRGGALIVVPPQGKPCFGYNTEMLSVGYRCGTYDMIADEKVLIARRDAEDVE